MNCMGQYFHPLYFPELGGKKEQIASDCLVLFDKIKDSLPVPNALVDFAWFGPGQVRKTRQSLIYYLPTLSPTRSLTSGYAHRSKSIE